MRCIASLVGIILLLLVLPARSAGAAEDLAARVARIVDAPTGESRRTAALALAADEEVTVPRLLPLLRRFGAFPAAPAGPQVHDVPLASGPDGPREAHTVVYVPASYDPALPTPLLLALHGGGSRGAESIPMWRAVAEDVGMLVLAPSEAGANDGYRFTEQERADVLEVLRWTRRRYNVDENRIHLTGISRGGHLAWDLALRHPHLWASLSPMIGGPRLHIPEGQNNLRYVGNVAHLPIRDLQGRDDDGRMIFNLTLAFERLQAEDAPDARFLLQSGHAHGFDLAAVDWRGLYGTAVRDPRPDRLLRLSARDGEGRAAWAEVLATKGRVAETFPLEVSPSRWNRLDDGGQRRYIQALADARTARLDVWRENPGRFRARLKDVKRFRILLEREDIPAEGPVEIRIGARRVRRRPQPSAKVLLLEFAERFDRTFLPVAEIRIP